MVKRIITITLLSLAFGLLLFSIINLIQYISTYEYEEIPFYRNLSSFSFVKSEKLLKKVGYTIHRKIFIYNREDFNCILTIDPVDEEKLNEWKQWVKQGRRLILFGSGSTNFGYLAEISSGFVSPSSPHPFFNDIEQLFISSQKSFSDDFVQNEDMEILLKTKDKVLIAQEKIRNGDILYISDLSFFSDRNVLQGDNAVFLNNLCKKYYKDKIIFDFSFQTGTSDVTEPFYKKGIFPFLIIQFFIIFTVFFLSGIKRFGPALNPEKYRKRSLSHHLKSVSYFFEKTGKPLLLAKIFDKFFIYQIQQNTAHSKLSEKNISQKLKLRINISGSEEDIFLFNIPDGLIKRQRNRFKFIKKIRKGEIHGSRKKT